MATLKEIAKKIDVSITTVSRVLNNDTSLSVSDDIRKKIIKTANKMDYKTPRNRVRLKSSNRLKIALVHWYNIEEEIDDPYYMQLRRGIEQLSIKVDWEESLLPNGGILWKGQGDIFSYEIQLKQGTKNLWEIETRRGKNNCSLRRITALCHNDLAKVKANSTVSKILQNFVTGKA